MKRIVVIITSTLVVILICLAVFVASNRPVTTGINVAVVPSDSEIFLDGKRISSGNNSVVPGDYTIEGRRANFDTQKTQITVTKDHVLFVPLELYPNDSAGKAWKNNNEKAYIELEGLGSQQYNQLGQDLTKKYPIIVDLPKDISPVFRIDYGISKRHPKDKNKIALYISSNTPADKYDAIHYIYLMGYDPSDYEIIFEGL